MKNFHFGRCWAGRLQQNHKTTPSLQQVVHVSSFVSKGWPFPRLEEKESIDFFLTFE